jgi:hypothetical protein
MRRMEEFPREMNGFPFLYADTFMTREEFAEPEVDVFSVCEEEKQLPLSAASAATSR